ncbi:MAG: hypothetical protein JO122_11435 [Acetobacteraceae bacterium]|nr:hypothetical protein [Acetobacteraceae bacterium]
MAPIGEVVRRTVLVPIVDGTGAVRKILGTSTDLTALRRAEAALFQAQKLEVVGQLTRGLAHDFNNLRWISWHEGQWSTPPFSITRCVR